MPKTILIVDDSGLNRLLLKKALIIDYDVLEAENGREALSMMYDHHETLAAVLLDIVMPEMNGYEVLRLAKEDNLLSPIPIIIVTGSEDEESRTKALSMGANDFALKPFNLDVIRHCLKNNIALRETRSSLRAFERDKLTGLYNREAFYEKTAELLEKNRGEEYVTSSFDVDGFKVINDQYGTEVGDKVLIHIADCLKRYLAENDGLCCRVAADNFAILFPRRLMDTAGNRSNHAETTKPPCLPRPINIRIGRYIIDDRTLTPNAMFDRASLALSSIKGKYGQYSAVYNDSMREELLNAQQIVAEMDYALRSKQFEAWFQPQYNHSNGKLIGAEALVRWRHPERGLIPPIVFIPLFEKNGFVYELDKFIWEEACRLLRKWLDQGVTPLPISVNISRYDLLCEDFFAELTAILHKYHIPTELLRLEITESAFAESTSHIVAIVKRLIDYGFTMEIDDFGSGYSSLNTLKNVPAQIVKLDMRFLEDDDGTGRGGNIIESIVRMTKWLGMAIIAEGVEEREQADYLKSIGCSYVQGYLYAKPMPAADYEALCRVTDKDERLITLETVENLDNNSFWNPRSMDTLVFNSYVGAACIFEYSKGRAELLRSTDKFAKLLGGEDMTVEKVLALDLRRYIDEQSRSVFRQCVERSISSGGDESGEFRFVGIPHAAHETYLRATLRVIATVGDRCLIYCLSENITAQRMAERSEILLAKRLQSVMDNVNCGISAVVYEDDGTLDFIFTNDRFYELLGYTREEYLREVGSDTGRSIVKEDRERVFACSRQAYAASSSAEVEYRLLRRDGSVAYIRSSMSSTSIEGIEKPVQLSMMTDITAETEAKLRERTISNQLHAVMANVNCGITAYIIKNDKAEYLLTNDKFFEIIGWTKEEYQRRAWASPFDIVHPDDRERVDGVVAHVRSTEESAGMEIRAVRGDGTIIWLRCLLSLAYFDGVEEAVMISTYVDITEQRRTEQELLDNLPGGAGIYEYRDNILSVNYLNKSFWELIGQVMPTGTGMLGESPIHPDDMPVIARELASAVEQRRELSCNIRLTFEKTEYRLVHLTGRIIELQDRFKIYVTFTPVAQDARAYQQVLPLLLSAMMESTNELTFAKDRQFRYLYASRAFAKMAGLWSEAEVIGKTDYELFAKEMADKYRRDDEAMLSDGQARIDMIEPIPSTDAVPHYSSTSKYLLRDGEGKIVGLYGIGRDITRMIEQNSQLSLVNDSVPGGLATYVCERGEFCAENIKLTYFNDGFCRLFGFTRADYEAHSSIDPTDLIFPEDRDIIAEQWKDLMEKDIPMDCSYRAAIVGGGYKWISHKAVAADRGGDQVLVCAMLQDVTEQHELIERLRISEEENNLAVALGGKVICRFDVAERTLNISEESAKRYGIPSTIRNVPEEPIRLKLIAEESFSAYRDFFDSIIRGEKAATAVFRQRYLGGWRYMEAKSLSVFSDNGRAVKAVISFTDITEQLEKETIYKKWQQSLNEKQPRSYSLFRCNLNHISASATAEGELMEFDFNAAGDNFDARAKKYADTRVFAEDRENYLAFANADAMLASYYRGKRSDVLEYREIRADGTLCWLRLSVELVQYPNSADIEAYLMYEDIDESKKTELQTKTLSETDPLTGLLNRAAFASKVDEILNSSEDTLHAMLMLDLDGFKLVNDAFGHGVGDTALKDIASGLLAALRADDLAARLGGDEFMLFLRDIPDAQFAALVARQVCEAARLSFSMEVQLSGSVGVVLAPKDGQSFEELYKKVDSALYYVKGAGKDRFVFFGDNMAKEHMEPEDAPGGMKAVEKKRRMLIVDDNAMMQGLLQNLFKDEFIIERADDGATALIRLRHYKSAISVVLLDLVMPEMDGFAVLEQMQQDNDLRSIPTLIVSGDESRESCLSAIRQGASDYITKPVDPDILRVRVHSAVSKAENERLRAQNRMLELEKENRIRLEAALESTGHAFIEINRVEGSYLIYPSVSGSIAGNFDSRPLWEILECDAGAAEDVPKMRELVREIAEDHSRTDGSMLVRLKTPNGDRHRFRMNVRKIMDGFRFTDRLILAFNDLDFEG